MMIPRENQLYSGSKKAHCFFERPSLRGDQFLKVLHDLAMR